MKVFYGDDANVSRWVAERIPHVDDFGPCSALGVVNSKGEPVAGVVFHDYQPKCGTIQISMAANTPRWATKRIIKEILAYPFYQLGVRKVWTATPHTNERAIRFNIGIGLKKEAVLANHFGKEHSVVCRMFRKQYEQLYGKK